LRSVLVESSWVSIKHDPALLLKYENLRKTMKGQQAIIRVGKFLI
jgi:hypothetical protein